MDKIPLLTIAIPTFNRAHYLDICLLNILDQKKTVQCNIEILVSDNCSTDNTKEVVDKYKLLDNEIRYIKNNENKGGDFNITQCLLLAQGQYVLCFGDDDILLKNSLKKIIDLLKTSKDFGHITIFSKKKSLDFGNPYTIYDNQINYLKAIDFYYTWISANIINTTFINRDNAFKNVGSFLNQVHIYFEVICKANQHVCFNNALVLPGKILKPEGYNFIQVFCINLNNILNHFENNIMEFKNYKLYISKILLKDFWPQSIVNAKLSNSKVSYKNACPILFKYYKRYLFFWIFVFPLFLLPLKFAIRYKNILNYVSNNS